MPIPLTALRTTTGDPRTNLQPQNRRLVWPRRCREVLVEPLDDYLRDGVAVLLHHHHVPISAETDVGQFDEGDIHARLLEVAHVEWL